MGGWIGWGGGEVWVDNLRVGRGGMGGSILRRTQAYCGGMLRRDTSMGQRGQCTYGDRERGGGGGRGAGREEGRTWIWIWGPILRLTGRLGRSTMASPTTPHIGRPEGGTEGGRRGGREGGREGGRGKGGREGVRVCTRPS